MRTITTLLVVLAASVACGKPQNADEPSAVRDSSRVRGGTPPQIASVDQLIDSKIPRAVAGQLGWTYAQQVTADLDVDSAAETVVLICDVGLGTKGQPMWEDGHRWQVYVEEADGARTYLYSRFLPNGKLTAELTQPQSTHAPTITLIQQTPGSIALYEIAYQAPGQVELATQFERTITSPTFAGSPRP